MSNIQIETEADNIINTLPEIYIPMNSNIEIETLKNEDDLKSTNNDANDDFEFLVNKNKVYSPKEKKKEIIIEQDNGGDGDDDTRSRVQSPFMEPLQPPPEPLPTPPFKPSVHGMNSFFNSGIFDSIKTQTMSEDDIRKEKSYLLHQFDNKNTNHRYSPKILDMNNSLEEIKNELEYINSKRDMENNMDTWKQGMFLFLNGVVQVNNSYDPFDVDLSDWLKDIHYDLMRKGKFDEVLEELIIKWRGKIPMSAEMKLVGLLGMSLAGNVMSKKQEKRDKLKREQEEQLMEEKIQRNVQAQMEKMMQQQRQQQQEYYQQEHRYSPERQQQEYRQEKEHRYSQERSSVTQPSSPAKQVKLTGPSLSDEDILKLVQQDFADSTIAEDEISVSSDKKDSIPAEKKEKRGRGRPRKNQLLVTPINPVASDTF